MKPADVVQEVNQILFVYAIVSQVAPWTDLNYIYYDKYHTVDLVCT